MPRCCGTRAAASNSSAAVFRAAIKRIDTDGDVFRRELGVFDENVEIAIVVKNARVEQFEFEAAARCAGRSPR